MKMIINPFHRLLRKEIAQAAADKMIYMMTCPNERDTILWIIDPYDFPCHFDIHCGRDCHRDDCPTYQTLLKCDTEKMAKTYIEDIRGNARNENTKC